jgi:DNA-binding SARP family transcriptional activator/predicted negative regulator of RcsB-dependent stress response
MTATRQPKTHFSLLGRLRARRADQDVALGPPQQRAVLAALLLSPGRPVGEAELVEALWGRPPASAPALLRTYIWRLRQALEPDRAPSRPWQVLATSSGGYLLDVSRACVDWEVYKQRVGEADRVRAAGDPAAALPLYDSALALWNGQPLEGVPGPRADRERGILRNRHLDTMEARLRTLAQAGRFDRAAAEAAVLVERHPRREGPHEVLVESLLRAGRGDEALTACRRAHRVLREELGVGPGAVLRSLHDELRTGGHRAGTDSGVLVPHASVPRQMPHAVADFTGRGTETTHIRDVLTRPSRTEMPVVVITGMGGSGKTTLAMHSVQPVLPHYPDGQLYVDLRGADGTPADTAVVLSLLLRSLGEADALIPDDPGDRAELYRRVLEQRRVLVVLDNAADMAQVLPLLPHSPSCAVVVTSRDSMPSLPVDLRVTLEALPAPDALLLFSRLVGGERVAAEPHAARQVVAVCGGLPLALRIIGSRLAVRPEWSVAQLAERLADEQHRLAELSVDSVAVESSFALGHAELDGTARRAFRLLAVPAQSGFDVPTAAAILDAPQDTTRQALEQLVRAGLLEAPAWDRYRYHDLVLLFAQRLAEQTDSPTERHAALGRLLDLHLVTATGSYLFLLPGHTLPGATLPVMPGGPRFQDQAAVLAWASSLLGDILRLLTQTAASHTDRAATLLLMLDAVLANAHRHHEAVPVATAVAEAATAQRDLRAEARARYILGGALMQVGRLEDARKHILRALETSALVQDTEVQVMALEVHGSLTGWSDPPAGVALHLRAAALARRHGNPSMEAVALGNAVQTRLRMDGIDEETTAAARRQLELHRENGDRFGEAIGHYRNGQVLLRLGRTEEAIESHHRTLALLGEGEQDYVRAGTELRLAEAYLHVGRCESALHHAGRARGLGLDVRHEHLAALSLAVLGDASFRLERREEARTHWKRAVAELTRLGHSGDAERVGKCLADAART